MARKKKSKAVCLLEYAALRLACAFVNFIPYRVACCLAHVLAWVVFDGLHIHYTRTLDRIQGVFPEMSRARARAVARFSLANVLMNGVEMMRAPRLTREWVDAHVKDMSVYAGRLKALIDEGRGVAIMVPHSGNWYMAAWAMATWGIPLVSIAARQRNPYIDAWLKRQYSTIEVLERGSADTLRAILQRFHEGRAFAILPDLRSPQPDVQVPFFNGTANVSHGGAFFAVAAGAPLAVALMRRVNGHHEFDHLATLRPDPNATDHREEACRLTREAMALLDAALRKTPEQWFWFNKRWLLEPVRAKKVSGRSPRGGGQRQ